MSAVTEIAAVLADLRRLAERDPDALTRREEILATKRALVEQLEREREQPEASPDAQSDQRV